MNDYAVEKLNFVSNLNGTSLHQLLNLIVTFPIINFFSVLIKIILINELTLKDGAKKFWYSIITINKFYKYYLNFKTFYFKEIILY